MGSESIALGPLRRSSFLPYSLVDYENGTVPSLPVPEIWAHGEPPPRELSTLVHFCRFHAKGKDADTPAFTHVVGQPGEHERLSFADLDSRARAIAAEIQQRGGVGKPVLVVLDPGANYAASLFGCLYARAIAVPVYPPQMLRLQHTLPRLQAVIANAGAELMLSDRATIGDSLSDLWQMPSSAAIAVDEIDSQASQRWDGKLPKPTDVAVLQYTSGSTGNPRGVILTHQILVNNLQAVVEHVHFEGARSVQWVPPYHDMGLIGGILLPIYRGVETVIISPTDFVRDPLLWLRCIDHYRGTSNGAPNFGYELCIRRIDDADCEGLDLRSWKVAIAGAEPVRASTLQRFEKKFSRYGFEPNSFCPAFGMAETVVMATGSRVGEPYKTFHVDVSALQLGRVLLASSTAERDAHASPTKELVSSGVPVAGMHYEIVDPDTRLPLPDGQIGEIWIRGSSVAAGYWRDQDATQQNFQARLAAPVQREHVPAMDSDTDYLRTGDLAARVDGELIVTGRLKEMIIVAGRNYYPHDIEQIVQATSDAFKPDTGTVIGVDVDDSEQMVVIQELSRPKKFDANELLQTVLAAIIEKAQVTPHAIVFVRSGSLPKTSSGKLRRSDARELFLGNQLAELARWQAGAVACSEPRPFAPPQTDSEIAIATIWSRSLNVAAVSRSDNFFQLGGASLLIAQMLIEVGEQFSASIPITTLFQHPTLQEFAAAVDSLSTAADRPLAINSSGRSLADPHPLSAAQQRFWLLDQLGQTNAFVHVPCAIELAGELDQEVFQRALHDVVMRHPMLRTSLIETEQGVQQVVSETVAIQIGQLGRRDSNEFDQDAFARDLDHFVRTPMDLGQAPLMRVAFSRSAAARTRIDIVMHHTVCDASSLQTLLGDLARAIDTGCGLPTGNPPPRDCSCPQPSPTPGTQPLRYVDYAAWDQSEPRRRQNQTQLAYWRQRLAGMTSDLNLPRLPTPSRPASTACCEPVSSRIAAPLAQRVEQLALARGLTPSMVYLTALQTVLARYGGSDDFGITIPTSNRPACELRDVVGCFVNPVIYRAGVDLAQSLDEALTQTREKLLADLQHADVPFQDVVAALDLPRDAARMPLSQVMFLYQPPLQDLEQLGDTRIHSLRPGYSAVTAYDLSLVIHPSEQPELLLVVGEQIDRELAERILASIVEVLDQMTTAATDSFTVGDLIIPAAAERQRIAAASYGTTLADLIADTLIGRVGQLAQSSPERTAIRDQAATLSYRELSLQSDRIAAALSHVDLARQSLIGVSMSRSVQALVAILGVWKAGHAYVPIDPALPAQRREQIVTAAGLTTIIDDSEFERLSQLMGDKPLERPLQHPVASDLAYVMFTSGSTGIPKGVAIQHGSVTNLLASFADEPGFTAADSMLAVTTFSFDISVLELFLPLWCGGQVCMTADRIGDDPEAVIAAIDRCQPSVIQSTPSAFRMLLSAAWKPAANVRLLCGGEPLMSDLARDLLATGCELWNVYGPTETTVWSTIGRIESPENITIGHAIAGTIVRVVDRHGQLSPLGVAGELQIGGLGVARGYFADDQQTRDQFITDQGQRFYKTGDQVRRLPSGELEFLARNDRQIKLRGFRIELDEIEASLQQCPGVDRAAVVLHRNEATHADRLVAFCSGQGDSEATRRVLADRLPDYMIPTTIVWLDQMPRTPAGKTDYRSLPIDFLQLPEAASQPPQTPLETALAEAWYEVLGCSSVGRHDHFFDLGGNSLMAAQLFSRLRQRFDVKLPLREIYSAPTIAALADAILVHQSQTATDDMTNMLQQLDSLSEEEVIRALDN